MAPASMEAVIVGSDQKVSVGKKLVPHVKGMLLEIATVSSN